MITQLLYLVTKTHNLCVLFSLGQVYFRQQSHSRTFGSTSQVGSGIGSPVGKQVDSLFQIILYQFINIFFRGTERLQIIVRSLRFCQQRHSTEKTNENKIIVGTQKFGFTQATVLQTLVDVHAWHVLDNKVATENTRRRATPYVQHTGIVGGGDEIRQVGSLDTVRTAARTDDAVSGYDIQRPHTHIIQFRPLKRLISAVHGCYRVFCCLETLGSIDGIPWFLIQKAVTAIQCQAQQETREYISELFHICQSIKGSI